MNSKLRTQDKPIEILLVEDNNMDAMLMKQIFKESNFPINLNVTRDGEDALAYLKHEASYSGVAVPDLILLDLNLPKKDGREVLLEIKKDPTLKDIPVMVLTGSQNDADLRLALESNASFFIVKPTDLEHLVGLVKYLEDFWTKNEEDKFLGKQDVACHVVIKAEEKWGRPAGHSPKKDSPLPDEDGPVDFIAGSPEMRKIISLARAIAKTDSTVLITGESGTGKERIAKFIHDSSAQAAGPFIAVNCGAITETLQESELFGHARGSFTGATTDRPGLFEAANGGTLFLDEIGEITPSMQVKLLRVLQEKEVRRVGENKSRPVNVRILSATNKNLMAEVAAKRFREDLFYRLKVVEIVIPPLRKRRDDIVPLAKLLLTESALKMKRGIVGFTQEASDRLLNYSWPGNVREMENILERAVALAKGNRVDVTDLPPEIFNAKPGLPDTGETGFLKDVERDCILAALEKTEGNRPKAAALLGMGVATIYRKLKLYKVN
jgi:DNA-binding NtrC family response regulator